MAARVARIVTAAMDTNLIIAFCDGSVSLCSSAQAALEAALNQ